MATPRAQINLAVEGAAEGRRKIESVGDALRRINDQSLQRLSSQIGGLNERISGLQSTFGNITSYAIAGVSLAAFGSKINGVLDSLGQLDDLAQKSGASVEQLSQIQKVAKAFGVDFGTVDSAVVKLARGLTTIDEKGSKTQKALNAIGVSARDSAGKLRDPSKVMIDVAKALQDYEDGAGKAALVTDLFGKAGADLLPFFNDLAENVDRFSTVSKEAVTQASSLQDKLGLLGVRTDEIATSITAAALPALTDLADGFSDVLEAKDGLVKNGDLAEWADNLAVGLARVADVAVLIPRTLSAIWSSVKVVGADVKFLSTIADNTNPVKAAVKVAQGGNPLADIKKAAEERNAVLADANKKYDDLWNKPANQFEQAVLKRIANRVSDAPPVASSPESPGKGKGKESLDNYKSGDDESKDVERQADAYRDLTAAIRERIAQSQAELAAGKPVNAARQEQIKLDEALASGKLKLSPLQKAQVDNLLQELNTNLEVIESNKRAAEGLEGYNKIRAEYETTVAKSIQDAVSEAERNEELAVTYGKTRSELAALEVERLKEQRSRAISDGMTLDDIENLEKLIAARKRNATALAQLDTLDNGKKALDDLNSFLDPARAQNFGDALREAFGGAGDALSKLTASLDGFGRRQAEINKQRTNADRAFRSGRMSEIEHVQALSRLSEMETKNRLSGYGDMANAAAGFFGEQSRGYQALMTVSKVFHAAELAMTMAELVPKGIAAVLTQGTGDPYTAFGRMASMAAIVAGLGVAIGGVSGSGPSRSEARQKSQGTGSVLGSDAKSESIAKSLDMIERATFQDLAISTGMLQSLRAIESNIGNFASLVIRTTGLSGEVPNNGLIKGTALDGKGFGTASTLGGAVAGGMFGMAAGGAMTMGVTGSMSTTMLGALGGPIGLVAGALLGAVLGKTIGKISSKVFGGQKFLEDTGLSLGNTSLATVAAGGLNAQQYSEIKTKGGWFKSDKYSTKFEGLGAEANRQFSQIIMSMANTIEMAAVGIGLNGDEFSQKLDRFVVSIGKISLKGKSGEEIEKELEAVFSKLGDDMARFGVAGLEQFQQVGEGYLETLTRVSVGYQTVDAVVQSLGLSFQSVGYGSIAARERLIELSGGLDEFTSGAEKFLADFYTEQERADSLRAQIAPTLDQYGIKTGTEDAMQQFRNVVKGLDLTTTAGAQAYSVLMQIAPAFKQIADLDAEKFEERAELQDEYDKLTMTSAQLLAKQRDALHESNRALFDQVQAAQKAKDAQDDAKNSLGNFLSQMKSFAVTAAGLNNNLVLGSMSVLTPEQQYVEARRQFEETRRRAMTGDTTAQGNLQGIEQTFLQLSQKINGGDAQYSSDLATVIRANDELSKWATDSVDVAQASLDALNSQVSSLNDISSILSTIAEGVQILPTALAGERVPSFAPAFSPVDYSRMGTSDMGPLVAEVKALRASNEAMAAELKAFRADQNRQTGDMIKATGASAQAAADVVVAGVREAVADGGYNARFSTRDYR